jgi:hypothetical protein
LFISKDFENFPKKSKSRKYFYSYKHKKVQMYI